ncbi:MAG: metal-dependent transcriptional regulator [Candidatus Fimivivens sp.]|nr:metal-dependent transcriptional regulator [Candidatus Fimivivens sp.]
MVIHASAEDYLEVILVLTERLGLVRSIDIVNELGYSKPSISVAMKKLRENGYIEMDNEGYITLLPPGMEVAQRIYRRHKLLKSFLISLGVDEATAAEDACKIEHCISEETFVMLAKHVEQDNVN